MKTVVNFPKITNNGVMLRSLRMGCKRAKPEDIVLKLRQAGALKGQCRLQQVQLVRLGLQFRHIIAGAKKYVAMNRDQLKRLKFLEPEKRRWRKAVIALSPEN